MPKDCPLCAAKKITQWKYEDWLVWVAKCRNHPDKWIIVYRNHVKNPSKVHFEHMYKVAKDLFPHSRFRGPRSIRDHFHIHEI